MHSNQLPNAAELIAAFHLEAAYPSNPMVQALLQNASTLLNNVIADTTAQAAAEATNKLYLVTILNLLTTHYHTYHYLQSNLPVNPLLTTIKSTT